MRSRRRKITEDQGKTLGSQLLGLTLFIMLLAFFIVMNSISTIQKDKIKPLRESLQIAFTSTLTATEDLFPSLTEASDMEDAEGGTTERLQRLFSSSIAGVEAKVDSGSGSILLRMTFADFKNAVNEIYSGEGKNSDFMKTLVSLIRSEKSGYTYRMDVFVQVKDNPAHLQNREPQKISSLVRDLSDIGNSIGEAGLPDRLMTLGIEQGDEGMVEILFRHHVPYNPLPEATGDSSVP